MSDGVTEDVTCVICCDILFRPVVAPCGHSMCFECLAKLCEMASGRHEQAQGRYVGRAVCPLCRQMLHATSKRDLTVCFAFDRLLGAQYPEHYAAREAKEAERPPLPSASVAEGAAPEGRLEDATGVLGIFVSATALLPFQKLHLHLFEPRYRALVRDAMRSGRRFGVMSTAQAHWLGPGRGAGVEVEVVQCRETPDGRYHVELNGRRPFRVLRQWNEEDNLLKAHVEYLCMDAEDEAGAEDRAAEAAEIARRLKEWMEAVGENVWLPQPRLLLESLKMALVARPEHDRPGSLAFYALGLLCPAFPCPISGMANDVRDAALSTDPRGRADMVRKELERATELHRSANRTLLSKLVARVPSTVRNFFVHRLLILLFALLLCYLLSDNGQDLRDTDLFSLQQEELRRMAAAGDGAPDAMAAAARI